MARLPGAEWRPLPEAGVPDGLRKTQLIYHSIVGSAEGAYGYFLNHSSLESTFIVKKSGQTIQLMDSTDRADANSDANRAAISVETEDNGRPDTDPWTPRQVDELVRIGIWGCQNHDIPAVRCPGPYEPGIGWHAMHGAPSPWTPSRGKTCPGLIRQVQFEREVLPRIIAGVAGTTPEVDDMQIKEVLKFCQAPGTPVYLLNIEDGTREGIETHAAREGIAEVFEIDADVHQVHVDVLAQFRDRGAA